MDEYLDFLAESAGEPPVSYAGIDLDPDYHVKLRRGKFPVGSSISDNRTISGQSNGCDFFTNDFTRDKRGTTIRPICVYVCRYRCPFTTVGGKLKRSVGGVVRSSPYFLRFAVRLHKVYRTLYHIR